MSEAKYWKVVSHITDNCKIVEVEKAQENRLSGLEAAFVKWDGCTNLLFEGQRQYMHSCDLDQLILELVELRKIASKEGVEGYEDSVSYDFPNNLDEPTYLHKLANG